MKSVSQILIHLRFSDSNLILSNLITSGISYFSLCMPPPLQPGPITLPSKNVRFGMSID